MRWIARSLLVVCLLVLAGCGGASAPTISGNSPVPIELPSVSATYDQVALDIATLE